MLAARVRCSVIAVVLAVCARSAASAGSSPGSMAPPTVCHKPVSRSRTRRRRPCPSRIITATDGISTSSRPMRARSARR